jgi:hypothetical protein
MHFHTNKVLHCKFHQTRKRVAASFDLFRHEALTLSVQIKVNSEQGFLQSWAVGTAAVRLSQRHACNLDCHLFRNTLLENCQL